MTRPPFPTVLDSTIMAAFKSCPQKAHLEFFQHWKLRDQSVHLHAGAAYAAGLEAARTAFYVRGEQHEQCVEAGIHAPLPGGKRVIEFSFAEPLSLPHPETGDPILYCGRMDMLCDYENMHLGEDDKTASQLGASWPRQWDLRSQFTGYVWGAARAGIKLDGFLVRGVSILKTKYDTLEAITYRPQGQLDRWYDQLIRDAKRMIRAWEEGYFDFNLDHACAEYGGCPFRDVCQMREPEQLLSMRFERRRWDPIARVETLLTEAT